MGGSSSSSSASTNEQKDNRVILEGSGLVATDGSSVYFESLDGQMVDTALKAIAQTTGRSLDTVDDALGDVLAFAQSSQQEANSTVDAFIRFAGSAQNQAMRQVDNAVSLVSRDQEARQLASGSEAERLIQTISRGNTTTMLVVAAAAGLAFITLKK